MRPAPADFFLSVNPSLTAVPHYERARDQKTALQRMVVHREGTRREWWVPLLEAKESGKTMAPEEFRRCLYNLQWSLPDLAEVLQCDLSVVEAMSRGKANVPPLLAIWLRLLSKNTLGLVQTYTYN